MVYIFSYKKFEDLPRNYRSIQIQEKDYPLREIDRLLDGVRPEDYVVLLTSSLASVDFIYESIKVYEKNNYRLMSVSEGDSLENLIDEIVDVFTPQDMILFKKEYMRTGLRDISGMSSYNAVREKIIKLCSGGVVTTSHDRKIPAKEPEYAISYNTDGHIIEKEKEKENKREYKVRINLGIGDIIFARGVLDAQSDKYDKVYISPNYDTFNNARQPNQANTDFTNELVKMVFDTPYYSIVNNTSFESRYVNTWISNENFPIRCTDLSHILCEGESLNIGPYVTISTKARNIDIKFYEKTMKKPFQEALKKIAKDYMIVVMGEQELEKNKEYYLIQNVVLSLYNDIISAVPKDRILDLSYKTSDKRDNDKMKLYKQDCLYMKEADWNIVFGNGGNFCSAIAVGNVMGYHKADNYSNTILAPSWKTVYYSDKWNEFIGKMNTLKNVERFNTPKPDYKACVYLGIGSLIMLKAMFDKVKDNYKNIYISPFQYCLDWVHPNDPVWVKFTDDLIKVLFNEPPYIITKDQSYPRTDFPTLFNKNFTPVIPNFEKQLCVGELPEELKGLEYIVITTKLRNFSDTYYNKSVNEGMLKALGELSNRHKIVIIGERELGRNAEYKMHAKITRSFYEDLIIHLNKDNVIDLSMPEWGLSAPSLERLQRDCVIMNKSKHTITLGIGGNFCMSIAVANTIGLADPADEEKTMKFVFDGVKEYPRTFVARDTKKFIEKIKSI